MQPFRSAAALAAAACAAAALLRCSADFEKQSEIRKLRVLAVAAEPAELIVQPDAGSAPSTTLTALAVEPSGAPIQTDFALCAQQGQLPAPDYGCPGDAGIPLPPAGPQMARLDLNDPRYRPVAAQLAAALDGGADGGPDGGLAGAFSGGIPILLGLDATAPSPADGGQQLLRAFTTVPLRLANPNVPINHNPQLTALQSNGAPLAADGSSIFRAGAIVTLLPIPAPDAKEMTPAGPERLTYSFYATQGSLSALRSTDTTATGEPGIASVDWTAPSLPGRVRFWVVVRDGRGGAGWLVRDVQVVP
ncbi:MAG TPA: hypothetical protein VN883_03550 [Myxococcales bacterium]|nr:hypothetical protein [Myxococcales bacterium]